MVIKVWIENEDEQAMFAENEFYLLNKNQRILKFELEYLYGEVRFQEIERYSELLPIGFGNIQLWIGGRQAPKHRQYIEKLLRECGCYNLDAFIRVTHALSLNDTFWVKPTDSDLTWESVSLYTNEFDETIAKIAFEGGLYGAQFTSTSPEFGTSGAFAKCWMKESDGIYLLKRGSEGAANAGLETYSEYYAAQVAAHICKAHVDYDIVTHHKKIASKCLLFTSEKEGFFNISKFLEDYRTASIAGIMQFLSRYDLEDDFRRMCVLDALIVNTDRHMGNYGLMVENDTMQIIGFAPIFDNNQSLLPYAMEEDLKHLEKYLASRPTKIGEDFNEVAHQMLTPAIKADLINLKGFTFEEHSAYNLSKERIDILNHLINRQIDCILQGIRLYVS